MKGQADTYKETKIFNYPGMVIRVLIPDLEAEERKRRLARIHNAAANLLKEVDRK